MEKQDKQKLTMSITMGLICFILVVTMYIQFNTISKTDITSIKNLRQSELKTEIANWKTRLEETQKKYQDTIAKKEEYEINIEDNEKAIALLEDDVAEAKMLLGLTNVVGNGVIITLEDNESKGIVANDLIELINELRLAGAEAICINNERITINSYIADIGYKYIVVNGQRCSSPYIVKAIGDQSFLESGLIAQQYGYLFTMNAIGKTVKLEKTNNITIKQFEGAITLNYVSDVTKEDTKKQ